MIARRHLWRRRAIIAVLLAIVGAPIVAAVNARSLDRLVGLGCAAALAALVTCVAAGPSARRGSGRLLMGAATTSLVVTASVVLANGAIVDTTPGLVASQAEVVTLLVMTAVAVRWSSPRSVTPTVGLVTAAVAAVPLRVRDAEDPNLTAVGVAVWALVALAAAVVGYHLRALDDRRLQSVLEARHAQRLQLASDLHDFVAHDVSEMLALAQAGSTIAAASPDEAELFRMIEQAAHRALRSMDQTVHMLHVGEQDAGGIGLVPDGQDLAQLPELARRFQAANGVVVHLDVAPPDTLRILPTTVSTVLYRVAVEALTNIRRHAPTAHTVEIRVRRSVTSDTDNVAVSIVNDGAHDEPTRSPDGIARRNGLGLPAMAARVADVGGTFTAGPCHPDRWRVDVTAPLSSNSTKA